MYTHTLQNVILTMKTEKFNPRQWNQIAKMDAYNKLVLVCVYASCRINIIDLHRTLRYVKETEKAKKNAFSGAANARRTFE